MSIRVTEPFDILLTSGRLIDGSGNPGFRADVGIRAGRIAAVGRLRDASARVTIDATGKVVSPGFIDAHVHGDLALFMDPYHEPAIRQGVTTYIIGQDGVAMAPASPSTLEYMCRYTAGFSGGAEWLRRSAAERPTWSSMGEYLACFDGKTAVNVASLVPNGNPRLEVMGLETREPTAKEITAMQAIVRQAMEEGAIGLSSGLDYIPSLYAQEDELAELCKAISPYGGIYVTHMRRYDPAGVKESMAEVYRIGQKADVAVHISHFNSQAGIVCPILDEYWRSGVEMTFDLYCYLAGSSILGMYLLPPWVQEGGLDATMNRLRDKSIWPKLCEWFASPKVPLETVRISYVANPEWKQYEGKSLAEAVKLPPGGKPDPAAVGEFVCNILLASEMAVGCVVPHRHRGEEDVIGLIRHPAMMGGSDGIYTGSHPHPRGCGCYARFLGHHVRRGTWTLEEAVRKLSSAVAQRFGLRDRGMIREHMAADVVVFDPEKIDDPATFEDSRQLAVGVEHVVVNGELVLHAGQRTKALPGLGLKRG